MPSDSDSADEVEMHYPIPCAFCRIADAYPPTISSIPASKRDAVPSEESFNSQKIQPPCFLILNDPLLMAFLDIMPMARGHVLVATRKHRRRIGEVEGEEGRSVGELDFYFSNISLLLLLRKSLDISSGVSASRGGKY